MRILFFSKNGMAADLARALRVEGNEVKLFIDGRPHRECFTGLVDKVEDWRKELGWVGKEGLIIFDDRGYGKLQDELRVQGYAVVGGSEEADRLELDRSYAQDVFREQRLKTSVLKDFHTVDEAVAFIRKHRRSWVIKQHNDLDKHMHYIGQQPDGSDVISVLEQRRHLLDRAPEVITLHERIQGIEIGVGRYFNGIEWVGPIEFNVEHTRLLPGDLGPVTNETGTLAWYDDDEQNRLYQETLARMVPYLQKIKFKGDFALNCIVNERGAFILEATPRFGSPIIHLQQELQQSNWGEFLSAIARGQQFKLKWRRGFGIVVLIAAPPFPTSERDNAPSLYGLEFSLAHLSDDERQHIHFEEVAKGNFRPYRYYVADRYGYLAYVTGIGSSIEKAQQRVYSIADKLLIPRTFYRKDIGSRFVTEGLPRLKKIGYLA